ncbi:MAG: pantoate kinase [Euryarchaeota archaeon]|nr:pantoate kinase [Euryarchaeota archaeon]
MTRPPKPTAAFAPAHITGFFVIRPHENPAIAGSLGCGIILEAGVTTRVEIGGPDGPNDSPCPTVKSVVSRLTRRPCSVRITSDIPIGAGFGASGAGALGTAFALNHALSHNLTANQLTEIAHIAEVDNRTGLGDVVAQSLGGVVIRRTPGASARLDRICTDAKDIFWVIFDKMSTKEVLNDKSSADQINPAGMESMRELLEMPTVENFMIQSRRFAAGTGLMSNTVADAADAVEAAGGMASQAMLGDSVFAVDVTGGAGDAIESALSEFGRVGRSRIGFRGVRLI